MQLLVEAVAEVLLVEFCKIYSKNCVHNEEHKNLGNLTF